MSHVQNHNRTMTGANSELFQTSNNAMEIEKIEYQQKLIVERMRNLDLQRKQLEKYLNVIQSLDSDSDDDDQNAQ